ncbi:hypothetical protein E27107_300038 [Elizabethkingia anophelis]|nr:hypothetical protein E18064_60111 [Elizabethkingia anophelis]CDN78445.1 hypothetical protein E27107_300038 [Elizabethkingia anophelis]
MKGIINIACMMKLVKCMGQENDKLTRNKVPWKVFILLVHSIFLAAFLLKINYILKCNIYKFFYHLIHESAFTKLR